VAVFVTGTVRGTVRTSQSSRSSCRTNAGPGPSGRPFCDGAERARLQHEAPDGDRGRMRIAGGDAGVRPGSARAKNSAYRKPVGALQVDYAELEDQRARNAPLLLECGLIGRFSHGLGP
jgi:hypothetical protein